MGGFSDGSSTVFLLSITGQIVGVRFDGVAAETGSSITSTGCVSTLSVAMVGKDDGDDVSPIAHGSRMLWSYSVYP